MQMERQAWSHETALHGASITDMQETGCTHRRHEVGLIPASSSQEQTVWTAKRRAELHSRRKAKWYSGELLGKAEEDGAEIRERDCHPNRSPLNDSCPPTTPDTLSVECGPGASQEHR